MNTLEAQEWSVGEMARVISVAMVGNEIALQVERKLPEPIIAHPLESFDAPQQHPCSADAVEQWQFALGTFIVFFRSEVQIIRVKISAQCKCWC